MRRIRSCRGRGPNINRRACSEPGEVRTGHIGPIWGVFGARNEVTQMRLSLIWDWHSLFINICALIKHNYYYTGKGEGREHLVYPTFQVKLTPCFDRQLRVLWTVYVVLIVNHARKVITPRRANEPLFNPVGRLRALPWRLYVTTFWSNRPTIRLSDWLHSHQRQPNLACPTSTRLLLHHPCPNK